MPYTVGRRLALLLLVYGCGCVGSHQIERRPPDPVQETPKTGLNEDQGEGNNANETLKFTKEAADTALSILDQIELETTRLGQHRWAGRYALCESPGMPVQNIALAPEAGFVFQSFTFGGLLDRNFGQVRDSGDLISLEFHFPNRRTSLSGIASQFVPVRWKQRTYLIPPDEMLRFCNTMNAGLVGEFFARVETEEQDSTRHPSVPEKYRPYLLREAITARILGVEDQHARSDGLIDVILVIDAGSDSGVLVGMEFHHGPYPSEPVVVTHVHDEVSQAVVTRSQRSPAPKVGWELSTRAPGASE